MDDYRLAPILEDASLFEQQCQDLFSLDLPPIQEQGTSINHGQETLSEPQGSDPSPTSTRRFQLDPQPHHHALPIAKVLNSEDISHVSKSAESTQDAVNVVSQTIQLQLPHPNVPHATDAQVPRIPPLLQGLHDPPPHAGLFPRITEEQSPPGTQNALGSTKRAKVVALASPRSKHPVSGTTQEAQQQSSTRSDTINPNEELHDSNKTVFKQTRRKNKKWSKTETVDLLKGVSKHGVGKWKEILNDTAYQFDCRSTIDLKDRYRVCSAEKMKTSPNKVASRAHHPLGTSHAESVQPVTCGSRNKKRRRGDAASKPNTAEMASLGNPQIKKASQASSRRQRTTFSPTEDTAIQSGYKKHGAQWSRIMEHPDLRKTQRSRGDVRDRWRVLSKRPKPNVDLVTTERKTEPGLPKTPMKLDHIIMPANEESLPKQKDQGVNSGVLDHCSGFIDPTVTWKPGNMYV